MLSCIGRTKAKRLIQGKEGFCNKPFPLIMHGTAVSAVCVSVSHTFTPNLSPVFTGCQLATLTRRAILLSSASTFNQDAGSCSPSGQGAQGLRPCSCISAQQLVHVEVSFRVRCEQERGRTARRSCPGRAEDVRKAYVYDESLLNMPSGG